MTGAPGLADLAAVAIPLPSRRIKGRLIDHPPRRHPSVAMLMADCCRARMRQFVTRSPRILDANVTDRLRQGTAFFASACMIAPGGRVALLGNSDRLVGVASELTLPTGAVTAEIKLILPLTLVAHARLKFVWAHRLFGSCAILMAAVPADPAAHPRAAQAAGIHVTAARGFDRGLRAVCFAPAALAWLLGPRVLLLATAVTLATLIRREFASASRAVVPGMRPAP